ncbi:YebC-like protein [Durotheca rogersii]|uniref:YebC-like protein n=1 Tax=Durotheca rogersii TaxID=419775 RepID=UPI002220355C|nr:YebC-like protein [Durotheca rogersii]KAI5860536.1 YebC-like protein [Durotheca rogersii]
MSASTQLQLFRRWGLAPARSTAAPLSAFAISASASSVCAQCRRSFVSSPASRSGHNRWSKVRHEKGAADRKKNLQRNSFSQNMTLFSKLYGPDPNNNPQLAAVIAVAKKAGVPKANIDRAIARGQGRSPTGEGLESLTIEVIMPPSVGFLIDVETDRKPRAMVEVRAICKRHSAAPASTAFLFTRQGRVLLEGRDGDFDDVLMKALEAGADDVEQDENGDIVLWTQPNMTHQAAQNMSKALSTEVLGADIVWTPTADKIKLDDEEEATAIGKFLLDLRAHADVQGIYANAERGAVSEDTWRTIEEYLD